MARRPPVHILEQGQKIDCVALSPQPGRATDGPHISAMMVTRGRVRLAMRAVACFLAQSWGPRELVVIDDDPADGLARLLEGLGASDRERVSYHRLADTGLSLGALRNIAVDRARGPLVCQWDDDDVYHPERMRTQVNALEAARADACSLWRHQILFLKSRRMCLSVRRLWEGSLLCKKDRLSAYPDLRRGEDLAVTEALFMSGRFALLDAPELYTYVVHGDNTFDSAHFEAHWTHATRRFEGASFERRLRQTAAVLPPTIGQSLLCALGPGVTL